jgi:hypothetical protein
MTIPTTVPTGTSTGADPGIAADLRRAAIDRLMWMNSQHARYAWQRRRNDPIAPHGLALLFAQPDERAGRERRYRLTAATRLWLAGDESRDLADRLFRYHHRMADALAGPDADVRAQANKRDPEMTDDAVYVGLGVSSLDTSTGDWEQVVATSRITTLITTRSAKPVSIPSVEARVSGEADIPGGIRILLTDGTAVVAERRGLGEYNNRVIHATHTLDFTAIDSPYPWGKVTHEQLYEDPMHGPVYRWMAALNDLFWQVDEARLVRRAASFPRRTAP